MVGRALHDAWRAFERAFWPLVLASGLLLLPDVIFGIARVLLDLRGRSAASSTVVFLVVTIAFIRLVARSMLRGGVISLQLAAAGEQPAPLATVFAHTDRASSLFAAQILVGIATFAVGLLGALPGALLAYFARARGAAPSIILAALIPGAVTAVFAGMSFLLTDWYVVHERLGAVASMRAAWRRSRSARLRLFALFVVTSAIELVGLVVGLLLFCVGLVFTIPATRAFTDAVFTRAYLVLRDRERAGHPQGGAA